jgi:hypothetical protein
MFRTIALLVLLLGIGLLGFGIWKYYEHRDEVRVDDAIVVYDNARSYPYILVGGAMVLVGGIAGVVASRQRS